MLSFLTTFYLGPDITDPPENVTIVVGDKGHLPCLVTGHPKPIVLWYSRRIGRLQTVPGL